MPQIEPPQQVIDGLQLLKRTYPFRKFFWVASPPDDATDWKYFAANDKRRMQRQAAKGFNVFLAIKG